METPNHKVAIKFIILLGIVSLFSDIASFGARSIIGAFLETLGANAFIVSAIAGIGELIAYGLRVISGFWVEKTGRYWLFTLFGYACNLFAVPLLAFAGAWPMAALLITTERVGKAIRTPARDAMLSHASNEVGMGFGFGLHQALDQFGGMLGPLLVTLILYFHHDGYRTGFAWLFLPALVAIFILFYAGKIYPHPQDIEVTKPQFKRHGITKTFWIYLIASSFVAAGFADFPLAAYHFAKTSILSPPLISLAYTIAMGISAISAFALGKIYDYIGYYILIVVIIISSLFAPFVFLGGILSITIGMILWGIGMGAQASLLKAIVGNLVNKEKRASAYGIFNAGFGIAWFLGSLLMGFLYDISITTMVVFSVGMQLLSLPFFIIAHKSMGSNLES